MKKIKKIIYLPVLYICLFIGSSANATVLDFGALGSGDLLATTASLPEATITNLSGDSLYVGAAGIANEICALSSISFSCDQNLEIDFNNVVYDLSFVVSGWHDDDFVTASVYDISNSFISSLEIKSNGLFDFGSISGISKLTFIDYSGSNGGGVSYDSVTFTVPEPTSLVLMFLGLVGVGLSKKSIRN